MINLIWFDWIWTPIKIYAQNIEPASVQDEWGFVCVCLISTAYLFVVADYGMQGRNRQEVFWPNSPQLPKAKLGRWKKLKMFGDGRFGCERVASSCVGWSPIWMKTWADEQKRSSVDGLTFFTFSDKSHFVISIFGVHIHTRSKVCSQCGLHTDGRTNEWWVATEGSENERGTKWSPHWSECVCPDPVTSTIVRDPIITVPLPFVFPSFSPHIHFDLSTWYLFQYIQDAILQSFAFQVLGQRGKRKVCSNCLGHRIRPHALLLDRSRLNFLDFHRWTVLSLSIMFAVTKLKIGYKLYIRWSAGVIQASVAFRAWVQIKHICLLTSKYNLGKGR